MAAAFPTFWDLMNAQKANPQLLAQNDVPSAIPPEQQMALMQQGVSPQQMNVPQQMPQQPPQGMPPLPFTMPPDANQVSMKTKVTMPIGDSTLPSYDDLKQANDAYLTQGGQALDLQKDQIQKLQGALNEGKSRELPINLQPLAALTDAWSGSQMAPYAAPAYTQKEKDQYVERLQQALGKAQQGMSQDQVSLLKGGLEGNYKIADLISRSQDRKASLEQAAAYKDAALGMKQDKSLIDAQNKMNADPLVQKPQEKLNTIAKLQGDLDKSLTNPVSAAAIGIELAKAITEQRINQNEIDRFGGNQATMAHLEQIIETAKKGTLTPENYNFMKQMTNSWAESEAQNLQKGRESHAKQYVQAHGGDVSGAFKNLTGDDYAPVLTGADKDAYAWAKANPDDPRASQIIKKLGVK